MISLIRFQPMVLAEQRSISYHTINNFRSSEHANRLIKKSFVYFVNMLQEEELIREEAIFIDGIKLKTQAMAFYDELIAKNMARAMREEEIQTSTGMEILAEETEQEIARLGDEIEKEPRAVPGGSPNKQKRRGLKKSCIVCARIIFLVHKSMNKPSRFSMAATVIPKPIMTLSLCI